MIRTLLAAILLCVERKHTLVSELVICGQVYCQVRSACYQTGYKSFIRFHLKHMSPWAGMHCNIQVI